MPMIVTPPYGEIVLSVEDAVQLMKIFEKAEKYRCTYKSGQDNTHHIYPLPDQCAMKLITQETYAMYKLAGKPED